jgi:hypothetical protein
MFSRGVVWCRPDFRGGSATPAAGRTQRQHHTPRSRPAKPIMVAGPASSWLARDWLAELDFAFQSTDAGFLSNNFWIFLPDSWPMPAQLGTVAVVATPWHRRIGPGEGRLGSSFATGKKRNAMSTVLGRLERGFRILRRDARPASRTTKVIKLSTGFQERSGPGPAAV